MNSNVTSTFTRMLLAEEMLALRRLSERVGTCVLGRAVRHWLKLVAGFRLKAGLRPRHRSNAQR